MRLSRKEIVAIRNQYADYPTESTVNKLLSHIDDCEREVSEYRGEIDRLRDLVEQYSRNEKLAVSNADRIQDDYEKKLLIMEDTHEKREREWGQRLKQSEADERRAVAAADRLTDENIKLKRSLDQANKAIEKHITKVKLPREVAEAIEECRRQDDMWGITQGRNFSLLDCVNQAMRSTHPSLPIRKITSWVVDRRERRDILVQALVNGYKIDELETTKHKPYHSEIINAVRKWYAEEMNKTKDGDTDSQDKIHSLASAIEKVLQKSTKRENAQPGR